MIRRSLYCNKLHNSRIFPVFFNTSDRNHIPLELQGYDSFLLDGSAGYEALLRKLQNRPLYSKPAIGIPPDLETSTTKPLFARPGEVSLTKDIVLKVDISHILKYAPTQLIGREDESAFLSDAWDKVVRVEKERSRILTFVAFGGEGKTSLVAKWIVDEMLAKDWPGCDAAFAWSFYNQGTSEQLVTSSDLFLKEAISFFGNAADKGFAGSPVGAYEKGRHLARLVGRQRSLLVLDGLEPLQYAPTSPTPGELKDQGISALLKGLAQNSHGLCVITTRYSLPDLRAFQNKTVVEVTLLRLSPDAGVFLLKTLGVRGMAQELEKLVEDVKGHALTLTLLGGFLKRAFNGDIRRCDRVRFEKADEKISGGHAFRTMAAYEKWLLNGGDEGQREVAVLRLMGLFDRPADAGCLAALRSETILGITDPLTELADEDWALCLSGLESAQLLTVNRDAAGTLVSLDAHPLLREYFSRQLRAQQPNAWRTAHRRLYEYLCATTHEGSQPTLEDLQPLYQAVIHGCQAGLQLKACDEIYLRRILQYRNYYSSRKLGAMASNLGAVACFYDQPWKSISPILSENLHISLYSEAAIYLIALGRLTESLEPMQLAINMLGKEKSLKDAAILLGIQSELKMSLGDVIGAISVAEESVICADHSGILHEQMTKRFRYADALHQAGRLTKAKALFSETEKIGPDYMDRLLFYGLASFQYWNLQLADPERAAWQAMFSSYCLQEFERKNPLEICTAFSQQCAERMFRHDDLIDLALERLTLSSALLYEAILAKSDTRHAQLQVEQTVNGFRRAGIIGHLPRGLLIRAWLRFIGGKHTGTDSAQTDLDEAWEIAERSSMKLHMADIHLYRARLFGQLRTLDGSLDYPWQSPSADLEAAEKIINTCGYHRRDKELSDAKQALLD
ncbi:hypothetical protein [Nitrosomonas supralitoralis]|uniref:hypothetical protein n=1 Tax=Nitrosomonas supralitoralis TaxID=2116706 RepID=UPI0018D50B2F|nr:hypothetical protein [Nitrosomonas supralitoralis]